MAKRIYTEAQKLAWSARAKAYYADPVNKVKIAAQRKAYRDDPVNKVKIAARKKASRADPVSKANRAASDKARRADPVTKANDAVRDKARSSTIKGIFKTCKRNAKVRDINFEITLEDATRLIEESGMKCALSGVELSLSVGALHKASIDRIDSSLGYTLDNIQVVSAYFNIMKGNRGDKEFIEACREVVIHNA